MIIYEQYNYHETTVCRSCTRNHLWLNVKAPEEIVPVLANVHYDATGYLLITKQLFRTGRCRMGKHHKLSLFGRVMVVAVSCIGMGIFSRYPFHPNSVYLFSHCLCCSGGGFSATGSIDRSDASGVTY